MAEKQGELGAELNRLREAKGLSYARLGAETGVSASYLHQIVTGDRDFKVGSEFARKLSDALGVKLSHWAPFTSDGHLVADDPTPVSCPMYGWVGAGPGVEGDAEEGTIEVPPHLSRADGVYRVRGTSMVGAGIDEGDSLIVWRIDRLRMTAAELVDLLGEVKGKGATFVSLRNGIDSGASPDVLDAVISVLDSLALADAEVRSERIGAAIAAKEAKGEKWTGGRPKGTPNKLTPEVLAKIREMKAAEESVTEMGRVLGLSRVSIYAGLKMIDEG